MSSDLCSVLIFPLLACPSVVVRSFLVFTKCAPKYHTYSPHNQAQGFQKRAHHRWPKPQFVSIVYLLFVSSTSCLLFTIVRPLAKESEDARTSANTVVAFASRYRLLALGFRRKTHEHVGVSTKSLMLFLSPHPFMHPIRAALAMFRHCLLDSCKSFALCLDELNPGIATHPNSHQTHSLIQNRLQLRSDSFFFVCGR